MRLVKISVLLMIVMMIKLFSQEDNNIKLLNETKKCDYSSNYVVVYDSTDVDVQESGLSYVYNHKLMKTLTQSGANSLRKMDFNYDPLSAYIEIRSAKIYRKNGDIEIIEKEKIYDYPAPARMIYWGSRKITVDFGKLYPGDAVEVNIFRKGFTYALLFDDDDKFVPPMKGHFYDIVGFWTSVPVKEKVYRIAMPEDKPLQYEVYNGELSSYVHFPKKKEKDVKVMVNPTGLKDKDSYAEVVDYYQREDKIVYCWYKKDIKPFKGEPDMLAHSDVATKLLLSTSPDWYAKAVWFNKVNEDYGSFEVTPEIQNKVDELISGIDDEMEKISILNHWVAEEIRYSGISMGEGEGYTLHKGQMTFSDRCGVCKDKAGMLVTMLRAAGFESYPAMTMAGSRIDKIPADQFNHSVTVVKLSNGSWSLLDPTWIPSVREMWSSAEQQQQFLPGIPGGADLMTTPISKPENHYLKLKGNSELDSKGNLFGEFTLTAEGQTDALFRRNFNRTYKSSWKEFFPMLLSEISYNIDIEKVDMINPYDISKPFKVKVKYKISNYALVTDDEIIFTPLLVKYPLYHYGISPEFRTDTSLNERKYGFRQRCSKLVQIEETIKLPNTKKNIIPKNMESKGEAASFTADFELDGRSLEVSAVHRMNKRIYEADDWDDFKNALVDRYNFMNSEVILSK